MSLNRQRGFGIAELLVGMAVGMIVVGAAMQMLFTTLRSSNDSIKMARLEQDLRQTMQMVSRDLRRATAWDMTTDVAKIVSVAPLTLSARTGAGVTVLSSTDGALASVGANAVGGTLIHVDSAGVVYQGSITAYDGAARSFTVTLTGTWPAYVTKADGIYQGSWNILRPRSDVAIDPATDCALFAYDVDPDGAYANAENLGYRYDNANDAVEIRQSINATCASVAAGDWQDLTDPNVVQITDFSITDNTKTATGSGLNVSVREYTISITGQLAADTSVVRTLQETIRVRNDRLNI